MDVKDIVRASIDGGDRIFHAYVGDLDDAELRARPAPGMNPIAWQIGHLISSERRMVESIHPGASPALPEGFDQLHSKDAGQSDDTSSYLGKDEYLRLWAAQRAATQATLDAIPNAKLAEAPANTMGGMCPSNAHVLNLIGLHVLMHVGQFVPLRRKTGKPVVI